LSKIQKQEKERNRKIHRFLNYKGIFGTSSDREVSISGTREEMEGL